jgi:hypothetical protein
VKNFFLAVSGHFIERGVDKKNLRPRRIQLRRRDQHRLFGLLDSGLKQILKLRRLQPAVFNHQIVS